MIKLGALNTTPWAVLLRTAASLRVARRAGHPFNATEQDGQLWRFLLLLLAVTAIQKATQALRRLWPYPARGLPSARCAGMSGASATAGKGCPHLLLCA